MHFIKFLIKIKKKITKKLAKNKGVYLLKHPLNNKNQHKQLFKQL